MPTGTMNYTGQLTITTCWCGIVHAVPQELEDYQQRAHRNGEKEVTIYCPLGHAGIPSGKGEAARLRDQLAEQERKTASAREDARIAQAQIVALEAEATRKAKRAAAGVCPCCNRSFVQLARHMKSKHPDHATVV